MTPPHGYRSRYVGGCRCQACRDANALYHRRYRNPELIWRDAHAQHAIRQASGGQ